jgi:hypothetical protein
MVSDVAESESIAALVCVIVTGTVSGLGFGV